MSVPLKENLVTIWRVENEHGEGPFQHPETQKMLGALGLLPVGDPLKPPAEEDSHIKDIFLKYAQAGECHDWLFGVLDNAHYDLWFGDEDIQEILACANFSLRKYLVDPLYVHVGTNQCIFWRPAALQYDDP